MKCAVLVVASFLLVACGSASAFDEGDATASVAIPLVDDPTAPPPPPAPPPSSFEKDVANALGSETTFPTLDGASKEPAYLKVKPAH